MSKRSNTVLLDIQKQRNELLESLLVKAHSDVASRMKDRKWHEELLTNLIAQGLKELLEENIEILV